MCVCVCVSPQPLHKSLDPANLEQLITPLTTLGHLAQLAPEQFAAPLKSLVANFIVKDLLMNDRVRTPSHAHAGRDEPRHFIFMYSCICLTETVQSNIVTGLQLM